jgi:tetratricopeptide (TPR) repeat protein
MHSCVRNVAVLALCAFAVQAADKTYKPGEYDMFNEVTKDLTANNFTKAITDLDAWKAKYAETDYAGDRAVLYMKAYMGAKQFKKALDLAAEVMPNIDKLFADPKDGPGLELQILFNGTVATPQVPDPTPEELSAGEQAAKKLLAFDRRPQGLTDEQWTKLKNDVQAPAKAALLYAAMLPGNRAMTKQPRDCAAAEPAYTKALQEHPEAAAISYNLATALSCLHKNAEAIYEYERAAVIDPTLGGTADAAKIKQTADGAYTKVHGSDEGLADLKEKVKQSPLPPADFTIKTASQLASEKEAQFEQSYPQLALWMKIKGALSDTNGEQYFESQLKNSAVPQLRGVVVEAKPACRAKELLVAVPVPGQPKGPAEIALKLDKPLTGKVDPGAEIHWEGVPSAFTASPFLLTMDTETAKIQGLKTTPCAGTTAHRPVTKKKR